jgi:uncharacterized protein YjbI with pentapeptide repeats
MKKAKIGLVGLTIAILCGAKPGFAAGGAVSIPENSCQAAAGPLIAQPSFPMEVDGATLNDASDIKSLRSKNKDGKTLFIRGGNFSNQKFGNDNFSNICFIGTNLANTRWSKSKAQGIGFINSNLTGASFDRVILDYALLRNSELANVDASGAQLSYGRFDGGWEPSMLNLKLDGARMVGFVFSCGVTSLDGCSFKRQQLSLRNADLSGANIATFSLWDARIEQAILNNTIISVDQMTQFGAADVRGNVQVKADLKQVVLPPDAYRAAAAALNATRTEENSCVVQDTPLQQLLCQVGRTELRGIRDDIERLYDTKLGLQRLQTKPAAGEISVVSQTKAHERYARTLSTCAKKEEETAINCIMKTMLKRRDVLIGQLVKSHPLEQDGRALYVVAKNALTQAVAKDRRLAGLAPLVIDGSASMLLAFRDEDQVMSARGFVPGPDGQRCFATFSPQKLKARRSKQGDGHAFNAWVSGAEFTMGSLPTIKKKRVKKKRGRSKTVTTLTQPIGCESFLQSGPLVRLPVTETDFDRLWAVKTAKS